MHYYPFNIGDYARRTQRLSLMEDLAYRRLLDLYYLDEQPFNERSTDDLARDIGMQEHTDEVAYILGKFFVNGFNNGADEVIKDYKKKKKQKIAAGKASGKARKLKACEQTLNGRSTNDEQTNNQEPRTKNQEPIKDNVAAAPKFNFKKEFLNIGVSIETLEDWLMVRKKKKAANTKTAFNGLINQINKSGLLPENAIKLAAEKSWSGFNASWIDSDDKKGFSKNTQANINTMSDMDLD